MTITSISAPKPLRAVPDTQFMPLLQALLTDRFGLTVHLETRETPAYDMVVGKDGLKIHPFDPERPPVSPQNTGFAMTIGTGTMPRLARALALSAGRPVVDKTGLEGRFSYVLTYTPLAAQPADSAKGSDQPDLFTAVQQQRGLKLESKKEPLPFWSSIGRNAFPLKIEFLLKPERT